MKSSSPPGLSCKREKACFSVRSNYQNKLAAASSVDPFASFCPVVQWSSVLLILMLLMVHGLETRQVDYVNAFAQADLASTIPTMYLVFFG